MNTMAFKLGAVYTVEDLTECLGLDSLVAEPVRCTWFIEGERALEMQDGSRGRS